MPNGKPYIERRYVELEEETEYMLGGETPMRTWIARVDGLIVPTKERVQMSRSSKSAGEALLLLTEALAEQGWELR